MSLLPLTLCVDPCQLVSMARELRIQYPGAICRVLNRGDQREDIFLDDEDWRKFLATLEEA